ncbi:hypothetical protein J6Q66_04410 [bacterium]|nr:hypothetical protein [bacterium]
MVAVLGKVAKKTISKVTNAVQKSVRKVAKETPYYISAELTPAIVKELDALPQEEFWVKSVELLSKKYGLPSAPTIADGTMHIGAVHAAYVPRYHQVWINPSKLLEAPRYAQFGMLSHELCHARQAADILRTPIYDFFSKEEILSERLTERAIQAIKTKPSEYLKLNIPKEKLAIWREYRKLSRKNQSEADVFLFNKIKDFYKKNFDLNSIEEPYIKAVRENLGVLSEKSRTARRIPSFFKYFFEQGGTDFKTVSGEFDSIKNVFEENGLNFKKLDKGIISEIKKLNRIRKTTSQKPKLQLSSYCSEQAEKQAYVTTWKAEKEYRKAQLNISG